METQRLDFTDLYAFPSRETLGNRILINERHPSAGENPPGPTTAEPFAPGALYELKIDTDGDAIADVAYRYASQPSRMLCKTRCCAALMARRQPVRAMEDE